MNLYNTLLLGIPWIPHCHAGLPKYSIFQFIHNIASLNILVSSSSSNSPISSLPQNSPNPSSSSCPSPYLDTSHVLLVVSQLHDSASSSLSPLIPMLTVKKTWSSSESALSSISEKVDTSTSLFISSSYKSCLLFLYNVLRMRGCSLLQAILYFCSKASPLMSFLVKLKIVAIGCKFYSKLMVGFRSFIYLLFVWLQYFYPFSIFLVMMF